MEEFYQSSEEFKAQANVKLADYQALMSKFKTEPETFWLDLAKANLAWFKEPTLAMSQKDEPFFTWFEDGKINISYNCIDRHLETQANKAAIIFEGELGDSRILSYQELHDEVCKTANLLKSLGVKKGDTVTLYMPMCPEAIIAMHACLRIGAVHSVVFAGFSAQALRDRIEDLNSKYLITADGSFRRGKIVPLLQTVKEAIQGLSFVSSVICFDRIKQVDSNYDDSQLQKSISNLVTWDLSSFEAHCQPAELNAEDTSFVLYTSGSTGKPKGIVHTQGGYILWTHLTTKWVFDLSSLPGKPYLLRYASPSSSLLTAQSTPAPQNSQALPLKTFQADSNLQDLYWCTADVGWITGHSYVAYGPLSNGASIFIYEGAPDYPNQSRFWSMIEKYKVSILYTAPTAVRAFMQWGLEHVKKHDLSSLRLLGSVGEPINPSAWTWFYENIGGSRCPLVDTWWQTETGGIAITTLPGVHDMKPGVAGLALPGIEADVSEEGLLYLRKPMPSMARTIWGDDQRYIDTYWSNVIATASQRRGGKQSSLDCFAVARNDVYFAGDAATKDVDGYIKIGGRIDDVINVSGHRLGTAEIESALVSHELVVEAAVVSVPHEIKGEGIVAYCVCQLEAGSWKSEASSAINFEPRTSSLELDLKSHVSKMIGSIAKPERIIICSALPKTRSGKIMRRLLKDIAQGKEISGDISTLENKQILEELTQFH